MSEYLITYFYPAGILESIDKRIEKFAREQEYEDKAKSYAVYWE